MDGASVSEWVSAGLLFAKAIKELTYKHLGQGTMSKSCKFLCAWNHWWWKDNEVCTYLYISLLAIWLWNHDPQKEWDFSIIKLKRESGLIWFKGPNEWTQDLSKKPWMDWLFTDTPTQINLNLNFALSYYGQILPTVLQQASLDWWSLTLTHCQAF
jgi:hypothetical protein